MPVLFVTLLLSTMSFGPGHTVVHFSWLIITVHLQRWPPLSYLLFAIGQFYSDAPVGSLERSGRPQAHPRLVPGRQYRCLPVDGLCRPAG